MVKKSIKNKIKRLGKLLAKDFRIHAIYLFGSHARGEENKHSDIDICIVSPDFKVKTDDIQDKVFKARRQIDIALDPYLTTPSKFKMDRLSPLLHEVRQDGIQVL
jgi:predicted nucleotidyltransferase